MFPYSITFQSLHELDIRHSRFGVYSGSIKVNDLALIEDPLLFAESPEALNLLHVKVKPYRLKVSWAKTKVQMFGGIVGDVVKSVFMHVVKIFR